MEELILLTAAYRVKNLKQILDSICLSFGEKTNDVHVTWVICQDTANCASDTGEAYGLQEIQKLCNEALARFGMGYLIYPVKTEKKKNYGGTLYNEPLSYVKATWFNDRDPWIYILDDDNVVLSSLANSFSAINEASKRLNKNIVWFSKHTAEGRVDVADKRTAFSHPTHGKESSFTVILPDPSQILMRYSEIENMGFYQEGIQYDGKIWEYFDANFDSILFPNDWLIGERDMFFSQVQTTHNGLVSLEKLKTIDEMVNREYFLICQGSTNEDGVAKSIVLPKSIGDECYSSARRYYINKYYSKEADKIPFDKIDKIYILTQASTPERWEYIIWQFKSLGIYEEIKDKVEIIKGVRVPCINETALEYLSTVGLSNLYHRSSGTYNVGFFNCTNEHYRIIKRALAEKYSTIMIIEDDACFIKNAELIKNAINTMPADFSILHLEGYCCPSNAEEWHMLEQFLSETPDCAKWELYSNFRMWCTACLIYSKRGMEEFARRQEDFLIGVDEQTGLIVDGAYFYNYPIARQEDSNILSSSIDKKIIDDSTNLYLKYTNKNDYFTFSDYHGDF